jgi:hypothetical protein
MPAAAALKHPWEESLNSVDHAVQVNSEYPVQIFVSQARNVLAPATPALLHRIDTGQSRDSVSSATRA